MINQIQEVDTLYKVLPTNKAVEYRVYAVTERQRVFFSDDSPYIKSTELIGHCIILNKSQPNETAKQIMRDYLTSTFPNETILSITLDSEMPL